jgi:hypothetical protein
MLTGANHYGTIVSDFVICFQSDHEMGDFKVLLSIQACIEPAFAGSRALGDTARNDHQDLEEGMSRTMLKSVSGDAADLMVTQPEPTGQPAH